MLHKLRGLTIVEILMILVVIVLVFIIPYYIYLTIQENRKWDLFSIENNCIAIEHIQGHSRTGAGVGITATGQVGTIMTTTSTPSKTAWKCEDGKTYWRND